MNKLVVDLQTRLVGEVMLNQWISTRQKQVLTLTIRHLTNTQSYVAEIYYTYIILSEFMQENFRNLYNIFQTIIHSGIDSSTFTFLSLHRRYRQNHS